MGPVCILDIWRASHVCSANSGLQLCMLVFVSSLVGLVYLPILALPRWFVCTTDIFYVLYREWSLVLRDIRIIHEHSWLLVTATQLPLWLWPHSIHTRWFIFSDTIAIGMMHEAFLVFLKVPPRGGETNPCANRCHVTNSVKVSQFLL